jgi:hypothetical protein
MVYISQFKLRLIFTVKIHAQGNTSETERVRGVQEDDKSANIFLPENHLQN